MVRRRQATQVIELSPVLDCAVDLGLAGQFSLPVEVVCAVVGFVEKLWFADAVSAGELDNGVSVVAAAVA